MVRARLHQMRFTGVLVGLAALVALLGPAASQARTFPAATTSSPITLSADGKLLWVVNPGGDNVAVIRTSNNRVIRRIRVGDEPQGVAVDPNNRYAFVANAAAGTVTVIRITNPRPGSFQARVDRRVGRRGAVRTGAEPWNIVASPDGRKMFVSNSSQDTITVMDAVSRTVRRRGRRPRVVPPGVVGSIALRGSRCSPDRNFHFQPRGLAVSRNSRRLFVTSFFSFQRPGFRQVNDQGRQGIVCRLRVNTRSRRIGSYRPSARIEVLPQDTGFTVDKNLDNVPDPVFAWPNQMQSIVIRGNQAFLPNIAASPEGPQRFNNSTMAFVNVLNGASGGSTRDGSSGRFLNLHLGARTPEQGKKKLFFANPWAIGFTNQRGSGSGYVVSAGSDLLVKVGVSGGGALSFTGGAQTTRYIDLNDPANAATSGANAGKNPQGIAVNRRGSRAYVWNFVSRNISVVDLRNDRVLRTIRVARLPAPGSPEEVVAVGAEMFFGSRGFFNPAGSTSRSERLSSEGWQSCSSCHFKGLTDSVVWAFGTGPRKSLPLNASFNPNNRNEQKILNYSAVNDEIEDFDINVRNVSGPGPLAAAAACSAPPPATSTFDPNHGLIIGDADPNLAPCVINAIPARANADRPQVTVTLPGSNTAVPAQTAMREWVRNAIRTPDGPFTTRGLTGRLNPRTVRAGRTLFTQAGCANCHGGTLFSNSIKDYVSPPAANLIFNERTGTFTGNPVGAPYVGKFLRNIGSFNLGVPGTGNDLGNNIGGDEKATSAVVAGVTQPAQDALGIDYNNDGQGNGYTVPSLLGIDSSPPFYHNGACETLACVLSNVKHRTANGTQPDALASERDQARVVAFLRSLD